MAIILSTKKLSTARKNLLSNANLDFKDYDAISIRLIKPKCPKKIKNAVFSSKNAIKSVKKFENELFLGNIENCFCVGDKTAALLRELNQNVVKIGQNASDLSDFISKTYKNDPFYFFCGSKRREEIPLKLNSAEIDLFEVKSYETDLNSIEFGQKFDGILFFSPSGVTSFTNSNNIKGSTAFCIGRTSAKEAEKYTSNVKVSKSQTIESVIALATTYYSKENSPK